MPRWGRMLLLLLAVLPTDCTLSRLFRPRPIVVVNGAILTGHPARHAMKYIQRGPRFMPRHRNRGLPFGGGIIRKTIRILTPAFNLAHTRISLVFQAPTIRRLDGFLNEVVDDIHSTQNNELEDDIDLSETFNTAFNESDGQLAPPPRHRYRPPHRRPGHQGPQGPGRPGYGRPRGPDNGIAHGNGGPGGPGYGRPYGPDGQDRFSDQRTPWDDPYGMNITIASPIVANEIKLLNASIYVAVVRLVIPLSQGGLNANATAAGHARIRAASGNFSAAITSLNNLRRTVDSNNKHARDLEEASNRLIDDMTYMNKLLRSDGNQDEIAELVAKMIYDSVPVLNSLVLADVPPDRISAFFLNVIEGIVSVVVGETMLMASNRSNSMNDVVRFINSALRPLTISASYSTMSEPNFDGNPESRGPGPVFEDPPGRRNQPRNTFDRNSQALPPGNGDIRNDPMRNDPMRNDPMRNDPMRNDPMRNDPMRNDGNPRAGENIPPMNNQGAHPYDDRGMPRPGEVNPPVNNQVAQPFDDRTRPLQYSNGDPGRSRNRNPRGGDPRERDYPRDSPRGMNRRNRDSPRTRSDARQGSWDDQRDRNEPRRARWDDPRSADRSRRDPWTSPRAADSPRQKPWKNPATVDDAERGPRRDSYTTNDARREPRDYPAISYDATENSRETAAPGSWDEPSPDYDE